MRAFVLAFFASAWAVHAQPVPIAPPGAVIVVPPTNIDTARPPPLNPPAPPLQIPRPESITTCDRSGCWDDQGRRLERMGPQLIGPHGACTVRAAVVQCP